MKAENTKTNDGRTRFHALCAQQRNLEVIQYLLSEKVQGKSSRNIDAIKTPNMKDGHGRIPFHVLYSQERYNESAKMLVDEFLLQRLDSTLNQ